MLPLPWRLMAAIISSERARHDLIVPLAVLPSLWPAISPAMAALTTLSAPPAEQSLTYDLRILAQSTRPLLSLLTATGRSWSQGPPSFPLPPLTSLWPACCPPAHSTAPSAPAEK